jgi:hypothetical protein
MVEGVMNYAHYWQYMDPGAAMPAGPLPAPPYEVFRGPIGGSTDSYFVDGMQRFDLNAQGLISRVRVWGRSDSPKNGVAGFLVSYGPEDAPLMGPNIYRNETKLGFDDAEGRDTLTPPLGDVLTISPDNPIVRVFGEVDTVIYSIGFEFKDGTLKGPYGDGGSQGFDFKVPDAREGESKVLSSIVLNQGINDLYVNYGVGYFASGAIFGFRSLDSYSAEQRSYQPSEHDPSPVGWYDGHIFTGAGDQLDVTVVVKTFDQGRITGAMLQGKPWLAGAGACTGTFDPDTGAIQLTDTSGYVWTGTLIGDQLSGTYTGPNYGNWRTTRERSAVPPFMGAFEGTATLDVSTSALLMVASVQETSISGWMILGQELSGGGGFSGTFDEKSGTMLFSDESYYRWTGKVEGRTISGSFNTGLGDGTWSVSLVA